MKKSILLMVALCSVSLMAEPVRLGGLGPDTMIETRGVTAQGVTNIVDAAIEGVVVAEHDLIAIAQLDAHKLANNPHGITAEGIGALQAEADTLATVTARGATTPHPVTIGSRGEGAVGASSLANGANVVASGNNSHAEGFWTTASGDFSHAHGYGTTASGYVSHAEGSWTTASGYVSHAEGSWTTASGDFSHAQGYGTTASGDFSHAEGDNTTASGFASHASGFRAETADDYAYVWQGSTYEEDTPPYYSHGQGSYNINPVGGLSGIYIGETNLATTLGGYATTGALSAVQAEVADPWIDWSAIITPVNGTATVTRATGADPVLVLTDDVVISVPTDNWPATGVSRVSLSLWAGSHSVTLLTNTVEYSSTPTISTNDWTTILFRRTGDQEKWRGVGL